MCAVYRVEVQGVQNKSGGNEIRGDDTAVPQNVGAVTTPIRQAGRNSSMARVNEIAHGLNSIQSIQNASKGSLLSDGARRIVGQSPVERGNHVLSSVVPPLWNKEDEEAMSRIDRTNRMAPHDSDLSSDEDANH
jgi:hypothetical protein